MRTYLVPKTKIKSRNGKRNHQVSLRKTKKKKEQILAEVNGITESRRREIDHTIASDEQLRRYQRTSS